MKTISIVWSIEDVQAVREDLTDKQAVKVLKALKENHNAEVGINWDVIEVTADDLFPEGEDSEDGLDS